MRGIITIIFLLLSPLSAFSQGKPDLSGTWVLDESKSKIPGGLQDELSITAFVIVHRDPEVRVTGKTNLGGIEQEQESVYFSDGRGEINEAKGKSVESLTKWSGNKLVIKYTIQFSVQWAGSTRKGKMKVTESWELSKDGQKLTRTLLRDISADVPAEIAQYRDIKMVFTRSP